MLIVACRDDNKIYRAAVRQAIARPDIFGSTYIVYNNIPRLSLRENLYITAHGASEGDEYQPVIGDEAQDFWISGGALYNALVGIFPHGYLGKIYISACESSDRHSTLLYSFIEDFKKISGLRYVYGQSGEVNYQIPLPDDPQWNRAVIGPRS